MLCYFLFYCSVTCYILFDCYCIYLHTTKLPRGWCILKHKQFRKHSNNKATYLHYFSIYESSTTSSLRRQSLVFLIWRCIRHSDSQHGSSNLNYPNVNAKSQHVNTNALKGTRTRDSCVDRKCTCLFSRRKLPFCNQ
jgi:hypothetical protein